MSDAERMPASPVEWGSLEGVDIEVEAKRMFAGLDLENPTEDEDHRRHLAALGNYDLDHPVFARAVDQRLSKIAVWQAAQFQEGGPTTEQTDTLEYQEGEMYASEYVALTFGQIAIEMESREKDVDQRTGLDRHETFLAKLKSRYDHGPRESDMVEVDGETVRPLIVFTIDGDKFGRINKDKGHTAGDKVLENIGAKLKASFRDSDLTGRKGGDEFEAAAGGMGREDARKLCDRLSLELADGLEVQIPNGGFIRITASTAAIYARNVETYDEAMALLELSDKSLVAMKEYNRRHPDEKRKTGLTETTPENAVRLLEQMAAHRNTTPEEILKMIRQQA